MGTGEAVVKAEVTHKGKKKDAITQCALVIWIKIWLEFRDFTTVFWVEVLNFEIDIHFSYFLKNILQSDLQMKIFL